MIKYKRWNNFWVQNKLKQILKYIKLIKEYNIMNIEYINSYLFIMN